MSGEDFSPCPECAHSTIEHDQHGCAVDISTDRRVYERCHSNAGDAEFWKRNEQHALLVAADSLCSLILHRESAGLSEQTKRDLDELVTKLRRVTDPR